MTKEEVMNRLYDRYIRPTENKKDRFIGVEIEMPIIKGPDAARQAVFGSYPI